MSSSSDSESIELTAESVKTVARNVNLLPAKSREKYMKAYGDFIEWKNATGAKDFSESVFLTYFQHLAKTKKPSTLWIAYSMLKSTVSSNNDVKLDTYSKLLAYLKKMSDGFKPTKSKVFSLKDVETFLNEAPDKIFLAAKVALIFGIHGACRSSELLKITVDDVVNHSDDSLLVNLADEKTKLNRSFVIRGEYKTIVQKYIDLRPADMPTDRFFIRYHNGKCFKQLIGRNKMSNMPQEIATYLKLPDVKLYTGHCFRHTSATLLAGTGPDLTVLKRHEAWKSNTISEGCVEDSIEKKAETCEVAMVNIKMEPSVSPSITLSPRPSTFKQRNLPLDFPQNELNSDKTCELTVENIKMEPSDNPCIPLSLRSSTSTRDLPSHLPQNELDSDKTYELTVENIKMEPSDNPSMALSPRPSSSKQRDSLSDFPQNELDSDNTCKLTVGNIKMEPSDHTSDSESDLTVVKRNGAWSSDVAKVYLRDSIQNKAKTCELTVENIKMKVLPASFNPSMRPSSRPFTSEQRDSSPDFPQNEPVSDIIWNRQNKKSIKISISNRWMELDGTGWNSSAEAERYTEDSNENKGKTCELIAENIKIEPSDNPSDSGVDLTVLKRHAARKSSDEAEENIGDTIQKKAKTCEPTVENIKMEVLSPSNNPATPQSPHPSTSKQRDSPKHFPQNEPDSNINSNGQNMKSATITVSGNTVTINLHNCENISNVNINFC